MINRIGDAAQNHRVTSALLEAQTRSRDLQAQLSSGKVADRFSDIAHDSYRLHDAKASLRASGQYSRSNEIVAGRLSMMEGSVVSILDIATAARNLVLQRLSDAAAQPGLTAPQAELMLGQVVNQLNVKIAGRHLFAGSMTDREPVALDPAFVAAGSADTSYYRGDAIELVVRADDDLAFTYGMTADREGFQEIIGALRTVVEADAVDDRALLEDALDLINSSLPKLADYGAEIGGRQARLEDINLIHSNAEVYLQRQISEVEDVDLADAVTRMTQEQIVIESAMATIGRLSQLSLADFLR